MVMTFQGFQGISQMVITVNPKIFGVKISLDTSKNPKIKNMKIPCSEIIGVLNFQTDARIRKFFYSKISYIKIFGHKNFHIYGIFITVLVVRVVMNILNRNLSIT